MEAKGSVTWGPILDRSFFGVLVIIYRGINAKFEAGSSGSRVVEKESTDPFRAFLN